MGTAPSAPSPPPAHTSLAFASTAVRCAMDDYIDAIEAMNAFIPRGTRLHPSVSDAVTVAGNITILEYYRSAAREHSLPSPQRNAALLKMNEALTKLKLAR